MPGKPENPAHAQPSSGHQRAATETRAIATGLKSLYRTVVEEPIPDDLMSLLDSLDDEG